MHPFTDPLFDPSLDLEVIRQDGFQPGGVADLPAEAPRVRWAAP